VFGEGVREPLRVRAGWVPDETIKELEAFVAGSTVRAFPVLPPARGEAA
jgi:S-DNA-T family DNA segregation ATPase FtsK/SpoIIIE